MSFVDRLVLVANQNGYLLHAITSGWTVQPTVIHPRQTNQVDCGIWVIANIAAVLAGFTVTGIQESDILSLRQSLLRCIAALPVT